VKRIRNASTKAKSKAEQIWISLNSNVQKHIHKVNQAGTRGTYHTIKKRRLGLITPSPGAHENDKWMCGSPSWDDFSCFSKDDVGEGDGDEDPVLSQLISTNPSHSPETYRNYLENGYGASDFFGAVPDALSNGTKVDGLEKNGSE